MSFVWELKARNETLFYFGLICFFFSLLCLVLSRLIDVQVYNTSAWYKPFKFAFSTFLFSWSMAWYCSYLEDFRIEFFNWSIIVLLGFEILYIAIQASRGQLSHFNLSTPFYSLLYSLMAIAASLVTIYTLYVAILFFQNPPKTLPANYLWGIRLGLIIFVIFSFEGFVMGSRLTHTIGGPDGTPGLPILGWSYSLGDPRVAHFIGMHALQILPILSFYVIKDLKFVLSMGVLYFLLAVYTLAKALEAQPFWKL